LKKKDDYISKRSLKGNTIYAGITNLSDMLLFVLMILAGRFLGAKDFGTFSFAQSLAIVFLTFSNFGLNTLAIRDVARDRGLADRYFGNILSWKIILSFVALLSLMLTAQYLSESNLKITLVVGLMGVAVMIRFFNLSGRSFLQAFERFDLEALVTFTEHLVLLGIGTFVILSGYGVIGLAFAFLFARCLGCILTFFLLGQDINVRPKFDLQFIFGLQMKAISIGVALLVAAAYLHADTLILSQIRSYTEVGLYNAAFKIYNGLFLLPSIISTVLFPRLSKAHVGDSQEQKSLLVRGLLSLLLISIPLSIGGIFLADKIIWIAFGQEFIGATAVMQILFAVSVLSFQIWLLRVFLLSINMQRALMIINFLGLCMRIFLDLLLIPRYGICGAAIAAGVSECLMLGLIWTHLFKKHFRLNKVSMVIGKVSSLLNYGYNKRNDLNISK
jgi:O-antigen/teichoic acid export membrane protein